VALLAQTGLSSQAIAERLYLSVRTVDSRHSGDADPVSGC